VTNCANIFLNIFLPEKFHKLGCYPTDLFHRNLEEFHFQLIDFNGDGKHPVPVDACRNADADIADIMNFADNIR